MNLQDLTLKNYFDSKEERPTLAEIADETGIQVSRVFRVVNGAKMKLEEYEAFRSVTQVKVEVQSKVSKEIFLLLETYDGKLSDEILFEIKNKLERKIDLWNLKYS